MTTDKRIDLHTHSTYSDGVRTPSEVVALAASKGIAAIALADHDSLEGYGELLSAASAKGIEVLTGVELSCEHDGRDLHILGYGVDRGNETLQGLLTEFRAARQRRGIEIVEKLGKEGVNLDIDKVLAKSGGGALGRPHIAEAIKEAGYVTDYAEAFARYIGEGCPAYVEKFKMKPEEAVASIRAADGLAFVAHPGYYITDEESFARLLSLGFDGIEVHHPHHTPSVVARLLEIATERELLTSGGSDFHGFAGRDNLGEPPVPYVLLERIRERLNEVKGS